MLWGELRMRPNSTHGQTLCARVLYPMRSREFFDDVSMLMNHVTPKNNTPIVFLALRLVTDLSSHVYYSSSGALY